MKKNEQDILKRIHELEAENARLRKGMKSSATSKLIVTEGEYKGYPTISFEGPVRRFTLGLSKLRAIKEAWPQIETFLQRHKSNTTEDSTVNDDIRI